MKVTLTFDLLEELPDLRRYLDANIYENALLELDRELRLITKYGAKTTPQELCNLLYNALRETGWRA